MAIKYSFWYLTSLVKIISLIFNYCGVLGDSMSDLILVINTGSNLSIG